MKNKIFAALLLCVGLFLRINALPDMGQTAPYFEKAYVAMEQALPNIVHGGTHLYMQLLHGMLWLFGNKMTVGVILQIVLQIAAIGVLGLAVRKLCGELQALFVFGALLVLPEMISGAVTLSPVGLYLLVYGIAMWLVAKGFEEESSLFWCILGGAAIGYVGYLDVMGFALLLMPLVLMLRDEWDKFKHYGAMILAGAVSFFLCLEIDAVYCGSTLFRIFNAWLGTVSGRELQNPLVSFAVGMRWSVAVLLLVVCVGIITDKFLIKDKGAFRKIQSAEYREELWGERMERMNTVGNTAGNMAESTTTNTTESAPVNYIENPLPVPKRHKRPMLDFDIDRLDGRDYYDVVVSDNDDYDI